MDGRRFIDHIHATRPWCGAEREATPMEPVEQVLVLLGVVILVLTGQILFPWNQSETP